MKTILIISILLFAVSTSNGQSTFNKEQLELSLKQAQNLKSAGVVITLISSAAFIAGATMYKNGINEIMNSSNYTEINNGTNKSTNGALVMYAGAAGVGLGMPLLIVGSVKSNSIKIHLVKFEPTAYSSPKLGVGLSYSF